MLDNFNDINIQKVMEMKRTILMVILVFGLLALTACQQGEGNTINVAGNSEIAVSPDEAEAWVGYSVVKDTAEEAQNEVNEIISAMMDGYDQAGIDKVETENLNLYEERTWTQDEGSKVVGWRASQTLKVTTTDLDAVGSIVDIAVNNGANQVNNINFKLSEAKEKQYKQEALAKASADAKEKAEVIADSLGVRLGKIKTVMESNYYSRAYPVAMDAGGMDMEESLKQVASVTPKDVTVTANIQLVYYVG